MVINSTLNNKPITKKSERVGAEFVVDEKTNVGTFVSVCAKKYEIPVKGILESPVGDCLNQVDVVVYVYDTDGGWNQYQNIAAEIAAHNLRSKDEGVRLFPVDVRSENLEMSFETIYSTCHEVSIPRIEAKRRKYFCEQPCYGCNALPVSNLHFGRSFTGTCADTGENRFAIMVYASFRNSVKDTCRTCVDF